jgi:FdhE protein
MATATLIKRLIRERPHLREPLQFYRRVSDLWASAVPDDLTRVLVDPDDRPLRLARGWPLMDPPRFADTDLSRTAETWRRLLALMRTRNPALAAAADAVDAAFGTGARCAQSLAGMLGHQTAPPLPPTVPPDFTGYLVRLALRPSLIPLLVPLGDVFSDRAWNRPVCPLCGFPPGLAEELEHERRLCCSFCPAAWSYTVKGCPFCGNSAEQHLACAIEEVEPGYHVAICTRCKGYLKTVHAHEVGREVDPSLEDLVTVPLDHAAQHEGYLPPTAAVASAFGIRDDPTG